MPDITTTAVAAVKAPFNWARARPLVFAATVLVIVVLTLKFAKEISNLLGKTPIVGGRVIAFTKATGASA